MTALLHVSLEKLFLKTFQRISKPDILRLWGVSILLRVFTGARHVGWHPDPRQAVLMLHVTVYRSGPELRDWLWTGRREDKCKRDVWSTSTRIQLSIRSLCLKVSCVVVSAIISQPRGVHSGADRGCLLPHSSVPRATRGLLGKSWESF